MNNYQNLDSIIRNQQLKPLIDQVKTIKNADLQLKRFLSPPLSEHVVVCNIRDKTLILQTNSPAWSTRVNFIATEILDYMRNEGGLAMVERLKVKVVPLSPQSTSERMSSRSVRQLSKESAELLRSVATGISDKRLAAVLESLARHSQKKKES